MMLIPVEKRPICAGFVARLAWAGPRHGHWIAINTHHYIERSVAGAIRGRVFQC
jgi:hypothetical protein